MPFAPRARCLRIAAATSTCAVCGPNVDSAMYATRLPPALAILDSTTGTETVARVTRLTSVRDAAAQAQRDLRPLAAP